MMAKMGAILLVMSFVIPLLMARSNKYNDHAFMYGLLQYFVAIMGIMLLMIDIE